MKKIILIFLVYIPLILTSQELPKKPFPGDLGSNNKMNLMSINIGVSKSDVIEKMGGVKKIQTWINRIRGEGTWNESYRPYLTQYKIINNPYNYDLSEDSQGNTIEILWYYTDNSVKELVNDEINYKHLSPVVLKNNLVIGLGWGFFNNYSKKNNININVEK